MRLLFRFASRPAQYGDEWGWKADGAADRLPGEKGAAVNILRAVYPLARMFFAIIGVGAAAFVGFMWVADLIRPSPPSPPMSAEVACETVRLFADAGLVPESAPSPSQPSPATLPPKTR